MLISKCFLIHYFDSSFFFKFLVLAFLPYKFSYTCVEIRLCKDPQVHKKLIKS